jgi:hypothetical protein
VLHPQNDIKLPFDFNIRQHSSKRKNQSIFLSHSVILIPYGGSVTIASTLLSGISFNCSSQSELYILTINYSFLYFLIFGNSILDCTKTITIFAIINANDIHIKIINAHCKKTTPN